MSCTRSLFAVSLVPFALAAWAGRAGAAPSIPLAAPVYMEAPLIDVMLKRAKGTDGDAIRNVANGLMTLPVVGPIGYIDLDAAIWAKYKVWANGDSMGARAEVGAWGNFYRDFLGDQQFWFKGHQ